MHLFKIWSQNRTKKALILVKEDQEVYEQLVLKASQKLNIDGTFLVLESDGTPVDEDELLIAVKNETLLLLQKNEIWTPANLQHIDSNNALNNSCSSLASTDTILSTDYPLTSSEESTSSVILTLADDVNSSNSIDVACSSANDSNTSNILIQQNIPNSAIATKDVINFQIIGCNMEYQWINFEVPWHKIPNHMIEMCEKGQKDRYGITEIVHIIVNEMKQVRDIIPAKAFKIVANKMITKYPETFRDIDEDGVVLGDGSCSLKSKLQERYHYLRRPHKRCRSVEISSTPQQKKVKKNATAGCTDWAPPVEKNQEENFSLKEKLKKLKPEDPEFYAVLNETYADQRAFINNVEAPSVLEIQEEWPALFTREAIEWHFNKVTNSNIETLITNLQSKAEKICEFGIQHKIIQVSDVTNNLKELASLMVFAKFFKEDIYTYFYLKVQSEDDIPATIKEPCIVECECDSAFYIFMEQTKIIKCKDFLESLKTCFALYYVFNLQYPKEVSTFMEMLQRYYLKIHPDSGTKSKKLTASKRKVISLMNKLRMV